MPILLFLIGLTIGALINVLADDLPPDANGTRHRPRRPHCQACGQAFRPAYWLAVASWAARLGRCEHCGQRRRVRALLVELVMGLALPYLWLWAAAVPVSNGDDGLLVLGRFLAAALVFAVFLLIAVIDIEHRLILHVVVVPAALLIAVIGALLPGHGLAKTILGGLAGYGIMLGVFLFAQVYTVAVQRLRGRALDEVAFGGGDVNLGGVIGLAVGWPGVLLAVMFAILGAALYSVGIIGGQLVRGRYNPNSVFPYGPFLVLGALLIFLYGKDIAAWYLAR